MKKQIHPCELAVAIPLFGLILSALAAKSNFSTSVDRTEIVRSEQIVLALHYHNVANAGTPPLPTFDDFNVRYDRSQSLSRIVNNKSTDVVSHFFILTPTREGTLTVPGLTAQIDGKGITSQSITIKVSKIATADVKVAEKQRDDLKAQVPSFVQTPVLTNIEEHGDMAKLSFLQKNPELRRKLVQWEKEATDALREDIRTLRTGDAVAKGQTAVRLREIGHRSATLALLETLKDHTALAWVTPGSVPGNVVWRTSWPPLEDGSQTSPAREAAKTLGGLGQMVMEPLIAALKDGNENVRWGAVLAFAVMKDKQAIVPLIGVLKDKEVSVRYEVSRALGKIDPNWRESETARQAVSVFIAELKDNNEDVRMTAVEALGMTEDKRVVEPLIAALRDQSMRVRRCAVEALAQIKDKHAVEPLIGALKNDDSKVRKAAIEALGIIQDKRALVPLIAALKDQDKHVCVDAHRALEKIDSNWRESEAAEQAVPAFITALKDDDKNMRKVAAEALGMIRDKRAVEPLISALKDDDKNVRKAAAEALGMIRDKRAVESLIGALKDQNEVVRWHALHALAEIKDKQTLEPLIAALRDQHTSSRRVAVQALGKIKDKQALEPLIAVLKDQDEDVRLDAHRALETIDPNWCKSEVAKQALPVLIPALKCDNSAIRVKMATVLGMIRDKRAVEPLVSALKDDDKNVRQAAAEALGMIEDKRAVEPLIATLKENGGLETPSTNAARKIFWGTRINGYLSGPPNAVGEALRRLTGQELPADFELWRAWWAKQSH